MAGESLAPGVGLTRGWTPGTGGWAAGMDLNLLTASVVMQLSVESRTSPLPGSPSEGVMFLVPASDPTNGKKLAVRDQGAWVYITPKVGWLAWVKDTQSFYHYANNETWTLLETGGTGGATSLDELSDVDVAAAVDGKFLKHVSGFWIPADVPTAALPPWPVTTQTGASYTFTAGDVGSTVRFDRATAQTAVIPANALVSIPIGAEIEIGQIGAGALTIQAGTDVTLQGFGSTFVFPGQHAYGRLRKIDTNVWTLAIWAGSGGGGGVPHVVLTQAEYDALPVKDPDTFYFIPE